MPHIGFQFHRAITLPTMLLVFVDEILFLAMSTRKMLMEILSRGSFAQRQCMCWAMLAAKQSHCIPCVCLGE